MKYYFISVLISILANKLSEKMLKTKLEYDKKIYKSKNLKASKYFKLFCYFLPYVNIGVALYSIISTTLIVSINKLFNKIYKDRVYRAEEVKEKYELQEQEENDMMDSMILDGADKEMIEEALEIINDEYKKEISIKEDLEAYESCIDEVTFTIEEYELAKLYLYEKNNDINLSRKEATEMMLDTTSYDKECKQKRLNKKFEKFNRGN